MERHLRPQLQVRLRQQRQQQYLKLLESMLIRLHLPTITIKKDGKLELHQKTQFHLQTIMNLLLIQGIDFCDHRMITDQVQTDHHARDN